MFPLQAAETLPSALRSMISTGPDPTIEWMKALGPTVAAIITALTLFVVTAMQLRHAESSGRARAFRRAVARWAAATHEYFEAQEDYLAAKRREVDGEDATPVGTSRMNRTYQKTHAATHLAIAEAPTLALRKRIRDITTRAHVTAHLSKDGGELGIEDFEAALSKAKTMFDDISKLLDEIPGRRAIASDLDWHRTSRSASRR